MRPTISSLLTHAGVLLVCATMPSLAHAAAPDPSSATTRVEVDATALEGGGSTMEKSIATLSRNEVQRALVRDLAKHVTVVDEGAESVVHVRLSWKDYETSHYGVVVEVRRGSTSRVVVVEECKLCDEEKLATKVSTRVPDLLPFLEVKAEEPVAEEPEAEPPTEARSSPPSDEPRGLPNDDRIDAKPEPRPVGALGIAGSVVGAGGIAGIVYGGVLLARGTTTKEDADEERLWVESYVRPGRIWLGVGLGAAVVGAAMVAVDVKVLRRQRAKRMAVHPALTTTYAGITMRVRF